MRARLGLKAMAPDSSAATQDAGGVGTPPLAAKTASAPPCRASRPCGRRLPLGQAARTQCSGTFEAAHPRTPGPRNRRHRPTARTTIRADGRTRIVALPSCPRQFRPVFRRACDVARLGHVSGRDLGRSPHIRPRTVLPSSARRPDWCPSLHSFAPMRRRPIGPQRLPTNRRARPIRHRR